LHTVDLTNISISKLNFDFYHHKGPRKSIFNSYSYNNRYNYNSNYNANYNYGRNSGSSNSSATEDYNEYNDYGYSYYNYDENGNYNPGYQQPFKAVSYNSESGNTMGNQNNQVPA